MDEDQQNELSEILNDLINSCYNECLWEDTGWEHKTTRGGFSGSGCVVTKGAIQLQLEEHTGCWDRQFETKVFGFIPNKILLFDSVYKTGKQGYKVCVAKDGYWVSWLLRQLDVVLARRDKLKAMRQRLEKIKKAETKMPVDDSEFFKEKK